MSQILSDEERTELVETNDWYNFPEDLIKATEAKIMQKLREQNEPVAWRWKVETYGDGRSKHCPEWGFTSAGHVCSDSDEPLYLHPAPSVPEWISVDARLPPSSDECLTLGACMRVNQLIDTGSFKDWKYDKPTHWMPLPAPPMAAARSE